MYATEFKTVIKEPYLLIPEFQKFKDREVRIIIIDINEQVKIPNDETIKAIKECENRINLEKIDFSELIFEAEKKIISSENV